MKKILYILFNLSAVQLIFIPTILSAQPLQFELQPEAFPVTLNGWEMFSPWAGGMDATTPELCDIDADGDLDLFMGKEQSYISYFENIGNPDSANFKYITYNLDSMYMPYGGIDNPTDIDFADINSNGKYDAFVGGAYVFLYYNNGTEYSPNFIGVYDTLYDISLNFINGTHVALEDIDLDGDFDLFAGHYSGYIKYYENIGTSTDYSFQLISSDWWNTFTSQGYSDPCFGDLDTDGDLDLLVGTGQGKIYYYRNDGTPQVPQMTYITSNFCNIDVGEDASPELADLDGDGDLDLLVGRDSGANESAMTQGDVYYYENIGTPQN
nr:VCBS repeat-containing protein [Candidatus Neomarinimicrobiota bacterium]